MNKKSQLRSQSDDSKAVQPDVKKDGKSFWVFPRSLRLIGWSIGQWWKKPNPQAENTAAQIATSRSNEGSSSKTTPRGVKKIGNYAKNFLKGIAANINNQLMNPVVYGDPSFVDFGEKVNVNKEEEKSNKNKKAEKGI